MVVGARARVISPRRRGEKGRECFVAASKRERAIACQQDFGREKRAPQKEKHQKAYPRRFFGVSCDCADALEICVAGRALAELTIR